jgi:glutathione synthase
VKFLFVMDPVEGIDITKDSTFLFLAEGQARGHENYYCGIADLFARSGGLSANTCTIEVSHTQGSHWAFGGRAMLDCNGFDCIFMRKDPPFDSDFFFATHLLSLVDDDQVFMFNKPAALRASFEYAMATSTTDRSSRPLQKTGFTKSWRNASCRPRARATCG